VHLLALNPGDATGTASHSCYSTRDHTVLPARLPPDSRWAGN